MNSLIVLLITVSLPTLAMALSLLLWRVKDIHNNVLKTLVISAYGSWAAFIGISVGSQIDYGWFNGWFEGISVALIIMAINYYPLKLYFAKLDAKRCPTCHSLDSIVVIKSVKAGPTTTDPETGEKVGLPDSNSGTEVVYTRCCSKCNTIFSVRTEKKY